MSKNPVAIRLSKVTKTYSFRHRKPTLSDLFLSRHRNKTFTALSNLNIVIRKGERVGIIGRNGSGKTTTLKILAGITTPDSGDVKVLGKVVSLISLDAGFHADLSGRDNVQINGMLLGMDKKEILAASESIYKFADIGEHLDEPLFTYSQGMKLRLGFSVAIHSQPETLLLDETLLAGDIAFQIKIKQKLQVLLAEGVTVILVTHTLKIIKEICNRVVWLERGRVRRDGGLEVLDEYEKYFY